MLITDHALPSGDDSHCSTLPVWPDKFSVPFAPEQTIAEEASLPATVGGRMVICTLLLETVHELLEILHSNVYAPGTKPLTKLAGDDGLPKITVEGPETNAQLPVPAVGLLPASVTVAVLHNTRSEPAVATVGAA